MRYQYTQLEKENVVTNFMKNDKVTKVPEKEINAELLNVYPTGEYVEQRRYLITFNFFKRTSDGSQYWLNIQE